MSSRVRLVEAFANDAPHGSDRSGAYAALVACLSPEEACEALDPAFEQHYHRRRAVVRKLQADMRKELLPCHQSLLTLLEQSIQSLRGPKRTSAANTLLALAEALPESEQHLILHRLSQSSNGTVRKQLYRHLKQMPQEGCPDYLLKAWQTFGDYEAARLLLYRAPTELITHHFDGLEAQFRDVGYLLSRLYLRLDGNPPATLDRLYGLDPVSHSYVCVKLGVSLSAEQMVAVYLSSMIEATIVDDRSGLVMWCAGQMSLFDAVLEMQRLAEHPPEEVTAARRARSPWLVA